MATRINDIDMDYNITYQPKHLAEVMTKMVGYDVPVTIRCGADDVDMAMFIIRASSVKMVKALFHKNGLYASYTILEGGRKCEVCMRYYKQQTV